MNTVAVPQAPQQDCFVRMRNEDYHACGGISKSDMQKILRSPAHSRGTDGEETDAMIFGEAFHVATLEPDRFAKEYTVYPDNCLVGSGPGQKGRKAAFDEQCEAEGITVIKQDWMDHIDAMKEAVWRNSDVRELDLLVNGEAELSAFYFDVEFGNLLTKARMDWLNKDTHRITDLKSTTDARERPFSRIAWDKGYHLQAAHYLYTVTQLTKFVHDEFYFVAVERPKIKGQYVGTMVYKADDEFIHEGLKLRAQALNTVLKCLETGTWPGYETGVRPLSPPGWVRRSKDWAIIE